VGHDSFVPALLLGLLVLSSVTLFVVSFARTVMATARARRACVRHRTPMLAALEGALCGVAGPRWVVVVVDEAPAAYCLGLFRPWVVVSTGLLGRLDKPGLRAVLEHEASHRRRRDPLRATLARSLARALFFVPSLKNLAEATLAENEVSADAKAVGSVGRADLISALLVLLGHPAPVGSATMATKHLLTLRLDALESGKRQAVRLPLGPLIISAVLVAGLLGTAAWLPNYPTSHLVRSLPCPVARAAQD
jgi:Zn-dependent protease with chaperone function